MLERAYRLTNSHSFDVIYRKGARTVGKYLVLYTLESNRPTKKVGFVVGKKVGKSVNRNKIKRRLRESVRAVLPQMKKGISYIFVARTSASDATFAQLEACVKSLLSQADTLDKI